MIPFDVVNFANTLNLLVDTLDHDYGKLLRDNGVQFGILYLICLSEKLPVRVNRASCYNFLTI